MLFFFMANVLLVILFFFTASFPRIGKTESQIRVCIICLFLHWQFFCWSLSYFLQMFIEDVDGICCFVLVGSFLTQESRESNARVCSCINNIFVDCCDTYCKCLLKMLMVFVVLCFLALSWLRKAESPTRVCLVCPRYLQQKQPNATCACRLPVHAGLSDCYHCAVRPVWLVNCD